MNNVDPILYLFYCLLAFLCPPIGLFLVLCYGNNPDNDPMRGSMCLGAVVWMIILCRAFA